MSDGDATVDGGESGIDIGGVEVFRELTVLDEREVGSVGLDIARGDDGGDGVDEKNVVLESAVCGVATPSRLNAVEFPINLLACRLG